jgi:RNA polymerase sigma-54 factor
MQVQLQRPSFSQEQRLRMNPQLFQSIKMMALPVVELRERIQEELEKNPALEVMEDRSTVSLDDYTPRSEEDDYFEATSDSGFSRRGSGDEDSDEQRKFIEGVLSRPENLHEHLLWQLRLHHLDEEDFRIGELLIQNLNADGFHAEPPEELLKGADLRRIVRMIALVRSLDPQGTCVADYRESLLVQARLLPDAPAGIEILIAEHLDALERGKIAEVAKRTKLSETAVLSALERIKELTPFPGRQYDTSETRYVVPDLLVMRKEGEFVIVMNEEEIPVLGINPFFMKLSGGKDGQKPVRDFVKENIKEARWFIRSINQRNHTLLRVARAIVEFQRNFFMNGPKQLAPLTLKDIAQEIGVHETTVSRIANGKYIQTEWGIFEIRHFFTNSISGAGSGGSRYSKEGVKEIIREIISGDQGRLSDQEIADLLARKGIPLARRTVAKYRKELALGSSYDR